MSSSLVILKAQKLVSMNCLKKLEFQSTPQLKRISWQFISSRDISLEEALLWKKIRELGD
ncbi:MAG: hypothetical protein ABL927_01360 [Bdellovibrionales bacterium]